MTEVNLYNREELHHNCLVQVWHNTYSGKTSYAWRHDTERVEQIMEYACDNLCRFPAEYKDPDDLWNEQCDHCKLRELLEEEDNG